MTVKKSSRKSPSPSGNNQYCYKVTGEKDGVILRNFLEKKLYRNKKFPDHFTLDEDLPFVILLPQNSDIVCIQMTSKSKNNVERIEEIHKKLKISMLKVNDKTTLSLPVLFDNDQCNWWGGACKFGEVIKWKTLEHNGPYFTHLMEPYKPHKAPLIYAGKKYTLTPEEEEVANFYAKRLISENNPNITVFWTKDPVFNKNFWKDFKTYLTLEHRKIFTDWSKIDFSAIVIALEKISNSQDKKDKSVKISKKIVAAEKKHDYGYAMINGLKEPVGNYVVEPASIFLGRGENPKRGMIKREIFPEDVIINIGVNNKVPKPPKGHKWGKVVHNQEVSWLASWKDTISGDPKYMMFSAEGQLKGKSDFSKYEKARKLNHFVDTIRTKYQKDIDTGDSIYRQLGTVLYLIDNFGLRPGGEKGTDETDTVGATTLRVEHVKLKSPDKVIFDFLGKDSIRYYKEITVTASVFKNFKEFISGKSKDVALFDKVSAADINAYLKTFDKSFSSKVFRTRLASVLMYAALKETVIKKNDSEAEKKLKFDKANVKVAETLNHQRTVSAGNRQIIEKYEKELKEMKKELKQKKRDGKSIAALETRIAKKKIQIQSKNDTLNVAMSTSRANYIDPRIIVGWTLRNNVNISKIYTAVLQKKFRWAIETTDADWDYYTTPLFEGMETLNPVETLKTTGSKKPRIFHSKIIRSPSKKSVSVSRKRVTPDDDVQPVKSVSRKRAIRKALDEDISGPQVIKKFYNISFHNFSERSFAVAGGTETQIKKMHILKGIFNPNISVKIPENGVMVLKKVPGFIFPKKINGDDMEKIVKDALGYIESSTPMLSFYDNIYPGDYGHTFREIMTWDSKKMDDSPLIIHDFFPLRVDEHGYKLTDRDVEEINKNPGLRRKIISAYVKFLIYLGFKPDFKNNTMTVGSPARFENKDFLHKVTRIIYFFVQVKMEYYSYLFFLGLCRAFKMYPSQFEKQKFSDRFFVHWMKIINISENVLENFDYEKFIGGVNII